MAITACDVSESSVMFIHRRLLGPFYGAIAVSCVTRCRCRCRRRRRRCGHRCAGGVRQYRHLVNGNVKRLAVANGPNIFQMLLVA